MPSSPPTSVVLPTVRATPAVAQLADQLGPADELVVVCDSPTDPVASGEAALPDGVRLVVAGVPEGCSGKANALAVGMAAATNDRFVWTDDDFHHPPDWLDQLHADYEARGPVSELPVFVGRDPFSVLVEPIYVLGGTLGLSLANRAWGGAVVFERGDLDLERFLADLGRTVSDDGLLSERLDVTAVRRTRRVAVGGSVRDSLERHVRFTQIVRRHAPVATVLLIGLAILGTIGGLVNPLRSLAVSTAIATVVYAYFGIARWTLLLAYPAFLLNPLLFAYGLARRTFVWGGRRYSWQGKFEVSILDGE